MAAKKGKLSVEDELKIQKNYEFLLNELDGKDLCDTMFSRQIFDLDMLEEIKNANPNIRKRRTEIFLQKLFYSGPNGYKIFLESLKPSYPHVIEILETSGASSGTRNTAKVTSDTITDLVKGIAGLRVKDELNFIILNTISSKMSMDTEKQGIVDIKVLNQADKDIIIVYDFRNICVKSFWFDQHQNREFNSRITLDEEPDSVGAIEKLTNSQIAVSCCTSKTIYIINVGPCLCIYTTIHTTNFNWGICAITPPSSHAATDTRLVTGHGCGISIINTEGVVVKQMDIDVTGRKYTENPFYLALTPSGNILVSDWDSCLFCVTQERRVLWRYRVRYPRGIACDAHGNVYVADYSCNKVILVSSEGKFVKEVLSCIDFIEFPAGVYYDSTKERLYVTEQKSGLIKIFQPE